MGMFPNDTLHNFKGIGFALRQTNIKTLQADQYLNDKSNFGSMTDPTLDSFRNEDLEIICEVIKECIVTDPRKRPTMKDIITKLREVIQVAPEQATPRLSPLWWAELEILSMEAT